MCSEWSAVANSKNSPSPSSPGWVSTVQGAAGEEFRLMEPCQDFREEQPPRLEPRVWDFRGHQRRGEPWATRSPMPRGSGSRKRRHCRIPRAMTRARATIPARATVGVKTTRGHGWVKTHHRLTRTRYTRVGASRRDSPQATPRFKAPRKPKRHW